MSRVEDITDVLRGASIVVSAGATLGFLLNGENRVNGAIWGAAIVAGVQTAALTVGVLQKWNLQQNRITQQIHENQMRNSEIPLNGTAYHDGDWQPTYVGPDYVTADGAEREVGLVPVSYSRTHSAFGLHPARGRTRG